MSDHGKTRAKAVAVDRSAQLNRWLIVCAIVLVAFFASYSFAQAQSAPATPAQVAGVGAAGGAAGGAGGCCGGAGATGGAATAQGAQGAQGAPAAGGGGCCGGGGGPKITKQATVAGGVQKIDVDLSSGSYDPSEIVLKAGVPAEITFGQGGGCLAQVQSQDLNFYEDLSAGPKTITLPALKAGTYTFTCGMQMVTGTIVVK